MSPDAASPDAASPDVGNEEQAVSPEPAELSLFDFGDASPQPDMPESVPQSERSAPDPPPSAPPVEIVPPQVVPDASGPPSSPSSPSSLSSSSDPPVYESPLGNLLDGIIGQSDAVARLQAALRSPLPAYLFVGPAGAGLRDAACRFAGELLAARSATPERERRLALATQHPDLLLFDRVGAAMTADQARQAVREAVATPVSGDRKVIVLSDVDRAGLQAPILLKSVEEPPPSCVFVLLAEEVNRAMETLASRCVRVNFEALSETDLAAVLRDGGISHERASFAAEAAGGSIERARLLASDDAAAQRVDMWQGFRGSLDGTASSAIAAADAALAATEAATAPLEARHDTERAEATERAELYGANVGRSTLDERHRRELRRLQTDELTMGFAVLSAQIRNEASSGVLAASVAAQELGAVADAAGSLRFNVNQRLALSWLFTRLGRCGH